MFVPNQVKFTHSIHLSATAGVGLLTANFTYSQQKIKVQWNLY